MIQPEPVDGNAAQLAAQAMAAVDRDPLAGLPLAEAAVSAAVRVRDAYAASTAERAWGHALIHAGALDEAATHLQRAAAWGRRAGAPDQTAEARSKLAFTRVQQGRPTAALREIDAALPDLTGISAGRARAQRAIVLHVIGRLDEALLDFEVALRVLRRDHDRLGQQRLLINRALVHADRFDFPAGERDLDEAEALARQLERPLTIGLIANNRALMLTVAGDVPAALAELDRAEAIIRQHGAQLGTLHQDRAQLLLSVGLTEEAEAAAAEAAEAYAREGRTLKVPEVRLLRAESALLAGRPAQAAADARAAQRQFATQRRPEWSQLARLLRLRAERAAGAAPQPTRADLAQLMATLTAAGWPGAALDAAILAGQVTADRSPPLRRWGREQLAVATERSTGRGSALSRARGWYARALLARNDDPRAALVAARRGLTILDGHAATLGASDLRVHAAAHRSELVDLGLDLAFASDRPRLVFEWSERARASHLLAAPVRPPADPALRALLAELRAVTREVADQPEPPAGLAAQQTQLERRIRTRSRQLPGDRTRSTRPTTVPEVASELGSRAMLIFLQRRGAVHALTVVDGRVRVRTLADRTAIDDLTDRVTFAFRRLARPGRPIGPAAALLADAAARLDALLLTGLPELGDRELVIVPTGALHSLPWSLLPSCSGRPVTVAPSATLWQSAMRRRTGTELAVVTVAGPGLPTAAEEADRVAAVHGGTAVTGSAATVEALTGALSGADLLHLAAHGRLAADNPLFSSLEVADGPLMIYDIEELPAVPHTVVLAACDGGRPLVRTGDEILGLAVAFLARGAANLIAPVMSISDVSTAPIMVALHEGLRSGLTPADALARAQRAFADQGPESLAASAAFICLGAGVRPLISA